MSEDQGELQPIIVKKIKKGGGHHGGAWKVAYADFVTAMMAFFLLLWLLSVSSEEQLTAIANYFDPTHPKVSMDTSGAGGVLGGLSVAPQGAMVTQVQPINNPQQNRSGINNRSDKENPKLDQKESQETKATDQAGKNAKDKARAQREAAEEQRLEQAKNAIEKAIAENPELAEMKDNLLVEMTPEGLRIQIIDQEGKPMFASGSAQMFSKTRALLEKVTEIIAEQPNHISIRGHTDSVPYGPGATYTNWELSADRANSSRRVILGADFPANRMHDVMGKADTEHLYPDSPNDARNRRVSITLLKESITNPDYDQKVEALAQTIGDDAVETFESEQPVSEADAPPPPTMPKIGTFQKSSGAIEFP